MTSADKDTVAFCLRMPRDLYEQIKQVAAEDDRPITRQIIRFLRVSYLQARPLSMFREKASGE